MLINELLRRKDLSEYQLSKKSGVPYSTISDLCSGKTDIKKCSAITVYKLAKALGTTVGILIEEEKENIAEFDETVLPLSIKDYYKQHMKFRKNTILRSESAMEYLGLTEGTFSTLIKVYSTIDLPLPFLVKKVKNFKNIEYSSVEGVLVTSISKSFDDMVEDEETDRQMLDQALNNYYYKNNNSFDGIKVSKKNIEIFNEAKKIALEYYDN